MIEAYQVFETQTPLARDQHEFYVELYQKDIVNLRKELILNSVPNKSFFVTGQAGNGKSTTLNFLPDDRILGKYDVKYLNGRKVFNLNDVDIIDVILMIGFTVVRGEKELEKRFLAELEELKNVKLGRLTKEREQRGVTRDEGEAKASFGAKLPFLSMIRFESSLFAKYRIEKEKRDTIRQLFTLDKLELIEKVNGIIDAYNRKILPDGKMLLVIVDDLEKMRDQSQARELFINNSYVFEAIKATKIVTFPVHLATKHAMYQSAFKFGIRITENPLVETESGEAQNNRERLRNVIWQRLADRNLVPEDAAEKAVMFSGGNLRFLMEIMQKAARNAVDLDAAEIGTESVASEDVERAVEEMASLSSLSVMSRVKILKHIMEQHREPDEEELEKSFIRSILDNTIFAYFNDLPWYDLNPIIQKSVRIYAASLERSET